MKNNLHIVFAADNGFSQHLATVLTSIIANKNTDTNIMFYVIDGGIKSENLQRITAIATTTTTHIQFIQTNTGVLDSLVTKNHLASATYYRLAIPDILPQEIEKVLYLDCDMIVTYDLSDLFNTDITTYYLAAVKEPIGHIRKPILNIPAEYDYFNAGMLVMNLSLWRLHNVNTNVIRFIQDNPEKILRCDQDGLNALLYDKRLPLASHNNFQDTYKHCDALGYQQVIDAYKQHGATPGIIHFSSSYKPWSLGGYHVFRKEYYKYLSLSGRPISKYKKARNRLLDPLYCLKRKTILIAANIYHRLQTITL